MKLFHSFWDILNHDGEIDALRSIGEALMVRQQPLYILDRIYDRSLRDSIMFNKNEFCTTIVTNFFLDPNETPLKWVIFYNPSTISSRPDSNLTIIIVQPNSTLHKQKLAFTKSLHTVI